MNTICLCSCAQATLVAFVQTKSIKSIPLSLPYQQQTKAGCVYLIRDGIDLHPLPRRSMRLAYSPTS